MYNYFKPLSEIQIALAPVQQSPTFHLFVLQRINMCQSQDNCVNIAEADILPPTHQVCCEQHTIIALNKYEVNKVYVVMKKKVENL